MGNTARNLAIDGVSPDTALLVSGPPMTGKYELMLRLLSTYADSPVVISTKNGADRVREDYRSIDGDVPADRIGVIDSAGHQGSADAESDTVKHVGSPGNLTDLGVQFTELFETFHDDPSVGHVGVGFHSVSQLLMHAEIKRVYQFLQVMIGQIRSAEWFAVTVVDAGTADEDQLAMLQHHFDGLVETRENETGAREFRVRGLGSNASDWITF